MGLVLELGHIAVGAPLPVAVEDHMQMVQASGQHQGMNDVDVLAVAVHSVGVDRADGIPWMNVVVE